MPSANETLLTSAQPTLPHRWVWLILGVLFGTTLLALLALLRWPLSDTQGLWQDPWFWQVVRFTFWQALLSSALAVGLALPLARALALDARLPGRDTFLRWCLICFVMPSLVLITGLVILFGRQGWLTPWMPGQWQLYGLNGILLAHVFLNLPLAVRVLTFQWQGIPGSAWKMAAQLSLTPWQRFKWLEWPAIRTLLPALAGFIFLLCFNSFAVVLALGGGPAASTLEVAIFQALKYQFNPAEAVGLALTQLFLAGGLFWMLSRLGQFQWLAPAGDTSGWRPKTGLIACWMGRVYYLLVILFLTLPVLSLMPSAWLGLGWHFPWQRFFTATGWSILFSLGAASLSVLFALLLSWSATQRPHPFWSRLIGLGALHHLVVPGMVLSVGLYIFFMVWVDWLRWGWVAVVLLNSLVALPFAYSQLYPALQQYFANYRRLSLSLSLTGWPHWSFVVWPYLRPALQRVAGLCWILVLGDLAIVGVFDAPAYTTLPWLIYDLAGSYRLQEAAFAALGLLILALVSLHWLEKERTHAH